MTTVKFGSKTSSDDAPPLAVTDDLIHQVSSNDEVERREVAPTSNEADLSQSSTPSLARRRRDPRSLEPIVRHHDDADLCEGLSGQFRTGARASHHPQSKQEDPHLQIAYISPNRCRRQPSLTAVVGPQLSTKLQRTCQDEPLFCADTCQRHRQTACTRQSVWSRPGAEASWCLTMRLSDAGMRR